MRFSQLVKSFVGNSGKSEAALPEGELLLSKLARIRSCRDAQIDFDAEVARARRYQRPLCVLVLRCIDGQQGLGCSPSVHTGEPCHPQLVDALLFGAILPDRIRRTDLVAHDAGSGRYVILMPEVSRHQVDGIVQRLTELLREGVSSSACVGVAEFPDDGLTLEEMISSADRNCHASMTVAG
jgi:hypothetical protein